MYDLYERHANVQTLRAWSLEALLKKIGVSMPISAGPRTGCASLIFKELLSAGTAAASGASRLDAQWRRHLFDLRDVSIAFNRAGHAFPVRCDLLIAYITRPGINLLNANIHRIGIASS
jgi:hypothetical protein